MLLNCKSHHVLPPPILAPPSRRPVRQDSLPLLGAADGDTPLCRIAFELSFDDFLLDADSGAEVLHLKPEEFVVNTRRRIIAQLPDDLPQGEYLLRVVSQCTTNPRPMKQAAEYAWRTRLRVGEQLP